MVPSQKNILMLFLKARAGRTDKAIFPPQIPPPAIPVSQLIAAHTDLPRKGAPTLSGPL